MAAEKAQLKVKKKSWYPVFTTAALGETYIGEITTTEPNLLMNRFIGTNLMNLTGNPKSQNINLKFKIEKVVGTKGIAYPASYAMIPSTVRRMVRRSKEKIDDAFACTTSDGIKVMVKPLMITKSQTNNSVVTKLRKQARAFLTAAASGSNYATLFMDIVDYRVQKMLRDYLKPLYPLGVCEIRAFEALPGQSLSTMSEQQKRGKELAERRQPEKPAAQQASADAQPTAQYSKPVPAETTQEAEIPETQAM